MRGQCLPGDLFHLINLSLCPIKNPAPCPHAPTCTTVLANWNILKWCSQFWYFLSTAKWKMVPWATNYGHQYFIYHWHNILSICLVQYICKGTKNVAHFCDLRSVILSLLTLEDSSCFTLYIWFKLCYLVLASFVTLSYIFNIHF